MTKPRGLYAVGLREREVGIDNFEQLIGLPLIQSRRPAKACPRSLAIAKLSLCLFPRHPNARVIVFTPFKRPPYLQLGGLVPAWPRVAKAGGSAIGSPAPEASCAVALVG